MFLKIELGGFYIMAEDNNAPQEQAAPKTGDVNISNDVVSIVASLAASSVKGIREW